MTSRDTNRPLTTAALLLATFVAAVEVTVVAAAMPTVIHDLGGISQYSWVFTAYLLASTVTVPIFGKLADLYGRKPIMLLGTGLFLAASVGCGAAGSMAQLIAFRALQGLGAGAMQPMSLTIIGDIFKLEERAKMQGVFSAVWGLAAVLGPIAGGAIIAAASWRWIFWVNVPVCVGIAVLLLAFHHEQVPRRQHALDVAGAGLLAVAILALLAASYGRPALFVALPGAVLLLGGFVAVEARAAEPVLPLDLLRARVQWVSAIAGTLIGGALSSASTFVPLYVQGVLGGSPLEAGTVIAPVAIGWPLASTLGGRVLPRVGFRPLVFLGLVIAAASAVALAVAGTATSSLNVLRLIMLCFGVGLGFANTALLIAVQTSVAWKRRGVATASTMFFRQLGAAIVIGALGGVLAAALAGDPTVPAEAANQLLGPDHGRLLAPGVLATLSGALREGTRTIFWIIGALGVAGLLVGLRFPREVREAE